jgi:4-oxalomesaconate tautomerase
MNLGDVSKKSIPKMTLVSSPMNDGTVSTRTFIPHRCHKAIGVLGAVSVATACLIEGTVAYDSAKKGNGVERHISIEHPTGEMTVIGHLNEFGEMKTAAILRTARKLMDGEVFA